MLGISLALCAGLCAALASSFAKFAMSPDIIRRNVCSNGILVKILDEMTVEYYCEWGVVSFRVFSFSLVFVFNGLMWTLFVKSLRRCSSTAVATVTNTGSNLVCTAIFGMILFGESQSLRWWMGASIILIGLLLIHHSNQSNNKENNMDIKAKDQ